MRYEEVHTFLVGKMQTLKTQRMFGPILSTQHTDCCPGERECLTLEPGFPVVKVTAACMGAWWNCPVTVEAPLWIGSGWQEARRAGAAYLEHQGIPVTPGWRREFTHEPVYLFLRTNPWHRDEKMARLGTERMLECIAQLTRFPYLGERAHILLAMEHAERAGAEVYRENIRLTVHAMAYPSPLVVSRWEREFRAAYEAIDVSARALVPRTFRPRWSLRGAKSVTPPPASAQ